MEKLQLIDFLKEDLRQLRKELEEFQENQIKALEELANMNDLDILDEKIKEATQIFNEESEGLLKEVFYVNRKIFEEAAKRIWEEAKERIGGLLSMDRENYIKYLKKSNEDFGINNDYLEGKKEYKDMNNIEKADIDFINKLYGGGCF